VERGSKAMRAAVGTWGRGRTDTAEVGAERKREGRAGWRRGEISRMWSLVSVEERE